MKADLHLHTTESDGTWTPAQIGTEAVKRGLSVIAITDHDTTAGVKEAVRNAPTELKVIPGIELSTTTEAEEEVHILGYWIDISNPHLEDKLIRFRESRIGRAHEIISKLNQLGIPLDYEDVLQFASRSVVSRSHIAAALQKTGVVQSKTEAFTKWLGVGAPAYVPRFKIEPQEAVGLILDAGGVPVLAHPGLLTDLRIISDLIPHGLVGIEVVHSAHSPSQTEYFLRIAGELGLIPSGGSDCHGPGGKDQLFMGDYTIPIHWVDELYSQRGRY